jgi:putative FmdB family regulatory protein
LYEYQCQACGDRTEVIQNLSEAPLETCDKCGGALRKLISAPAIQFKGSGFYKTDYASSSSQPPSSSSGSEGGAAKPAGDGSSSTPAAPAASKSESSKSETKSESSKSETKSDTKSAS